MATKFCCRENEEILLRSKATKGMYVGTEYQNRTLYNDGTGLSEMLPDSDDDLGRPRGSGSEDDDECSGSGDDEDDEDDDDEGASFSSGCSELE